MGTIRNGIPHGNDVVLHERPPEFMTSWDAVKHEDNVARWALGHPGETGNFAVDGPFFDGCDAMRAHRKLWTISHELCTSMISSQAGVYWVIDRCSRIGS